MFTQLIYKAILEKIDYAIIVADKEGNFTLWNDSAKKILGMTPGIISFDVWKEHFEIYKMNGEKYQPAEYPIIRATQGEEVTRERLLIKTPQDAEGKYLDVSAFPVVSEENKIIGAVANFIDVTQTLKLQEGFEDMIKTLNHMKASLEKSLQFHVLENKIAFSK